MHRINDYKVVNADKLLKLGWNYPRLLDALMALDYKTIQGLDNRTEGTHKQWVRVLLKSPETSRYLIDAKGNIVGYWHFVALKTPICKKIKQGKLQDGMIRAESIRRMNKPGSYDIYWIIFTELRNVRHTGYSHILKAAFFRQLEFFAKHGIYVNDMCTNVFTKEGEFLMKSFGLHYVTKAEEAGEIYSRNLYPFMKNDPLLKYRSLVKIYNKSNGGKV